MQDKFLLLFILSPLCAGLLSLSIRQRMRGAFAFLASLFMLIASFLLFGKENILRLGGIGFGIELTFRFYHFSGFIVLAIGFFTFLTAIYSLAFFQTKNKAHKFYTYLLFAQGAANAALLADNLVVMLFFWEGLLLVLFGMIAEGRSAGAFKTAIKAFVIVGIADLCMMAGIALTGHLAQTLNMSQIHLAPVGLLASASFLLLMIGAISKAGSVPFHTWIPDAAVDAPLPFMAYFPAALEKLLGIYFLTRICLDLFRLDAGSGLSILLMTVGAATILLAVMMALIQKDYKRLLSYHAVSQVGYMLLGIGTCLPVGIIGGIFHMLNNALYKCGLFFTAGAVEKETGTTDLEKLGGLRLKMPVTFACFFVVAASISGVPPFNGFFSKELIYAAALKRGAIFYIAALLGSFFTAASFLKLGHAAFLGKTPREYKETREAPIPMLIPMIILALTCIFFGVFNHLPIRHFIQPVLGQRIELSSFTGAPANLMLILITLLVLAAAIAHHFIAAKITGSGLKAAEHIHYAPVLSALYRWAEKKYFDPYEAGIRLMRKTANLLRKIDRRIDWVYESLITRAAYGCSRAIRRMHAGYYVIYVIWSLLGALLVMLFILK